MQHHQLCKPVLKQQKRHHNSLAKTQMTDQFFSITHQGKSTFDHPGLHDRLNVAHTKIVHGKHPALQCALRIDDLEEVEKAAHILAQNCDTVLVLGTGGSSLGGQTLQTVATDIKIEERSLHAQGPAVFFVDNVDPRSLHALLSMLNPQRTGIVIISKSGQTLETIAQTMAIFQAWSIPSSINSFRERIIVITEEKDSPIRQLATDFALSFLPHDPEIGGRFSVFSVVGALPALLMGIDVKAVRRGAQVTWDTFVAASETHNPAQASAYQSALFWLLAYERGCTQAIWWTYGDNLATLGAWWQQLFGESLGKTAHGRSWGMTPIGVRGTVDQHSQLQLYIDGPADKAFSMVLGPKARHPLPLVASDNPSLSYLKGKTLEDVLRVEYQATSASLIYHNRAVQQVMIHDDSASGLGALMMHLMLETLLISHVWEVDPYDQPAVEHGKLLARQMLHDNHRSGG